MAAFEKLQHKQKEEMIRVGIKIMRMIEEGKRLEEVAMKTGLAEVDIKRYISESDVERIR